MIDIACGLLLLFTATMNWFGLLHCIHWLSRRSCGPDGKRWQFWLLTALFTIAGFALVIYHGLYGLFKLAFGIMTWGY